MAQFAWFIWLFSSFYFEKCKNLRCKVLLLCCLCKYQRLVTNTLVSLALNRLNPPVTVCRAAPGLVFSQPVQRRCEFEQSACEAWMSSSLLCHFAERVTSNTINSHACAVYQKIGRHRTTAGGRHDHSWFTVLLHQIMWYKLDIRLQERLSSTCLSFQCL